MIRNPRREDREAPPNLPVGTVNIDALARHQRKGSNKSSNTSCSVWALIRLWCLSAEVDFESFGERGNSARRRTAIELGLLRRVDGRLPSVIYTGHAFLWQEKLLRCVRSEIPMIGTRVAPGGRVSYDRSARFSIKWVGRLYLNVPPPVCCMHFRIYPLSTVVVFPPRRVDQVISVCDLAKEIQDTI